MEPARQIESEREEHSCPECGRPYARRRYGMTPKQAQLIEYLESHIDYQGVAPSYQEMADAMGLKSKSGIHRLIRELADRGLVRMMPYRARSIQVVRP